ncbi:MAG: glycosyltransferase [Planctomycetes bacterium]|nr:glycosyltransferase [Planctomycetota bacterium]MCB9889126.1 glycosyltransferase [Planctomycetota bacterium]
MTLLDVFVSVVVPLRDDRDIVVSFVDELVGVLRGSVSHYEVILVDQGSTDDTVDAVRGLLERLDHLRLLRLARPFGAETAILAGLETVIGDFVVVMMPDTDPPQLVPELVATARAGHDIVSGVRADAARDPLYMRVLGPAFYAYCNRVLKLALPPHTTELRVLSRQVVNAVIRSRDMMRFMRMYSAYVGYPSTVVSYRPHSRRGRPRRRSFGEIMQRSIGIIVANSTHPLRVISVLGVLISGANALYAGYVLLTYLLARDVAPGWATLSLQASVMFLFLFLTQAILCEYIGRLLQEGSRVPDFHVLEERHSAVLLDEDRRKNVVGGEDGRP